jgi:hypothetical protein
VKGDIPELSKSIKRPNLRIMGIEEGEEVKTKRIHNIFKKIIKRKFPKSRESFAHSGTGHQTDLTKVEPPHIKVKPSKSQQISQ